MTAGQPCRPIVLMYHRVADKGEDPWGTAVSAEHLRQHLDILGRRRRVIPLRQLVDALRSGQPLQDAAAVTFDDGYADNFHRARPLLEERGLPATFFIATGPIGGAEEIWWDELGRILLQPGRLPTMLRLEIGGVAHDWDIDAELDDGPGATAMTHWRGWQPPPTRRHAAYLTLQELLVARPPAEQQQLLRQLRAWADRPAAARPERRFMTADHIVRLAANRSFEIAAHSVTHRVLPQTTAAACRYEAAASKKFLEEVTGTAVRGFAYPYGQCDRRTAARVRGAGFAYACGADSRPIDRDADAFCLPRHQVFDCDGEEFERQLSTGFAVREPRPAMFNAARNIFPVLFPAVKKRLAIMRSRLAAGR